MARRGENIYLRKDGRYEGRYIKGRRPDRKPVYGYVYARKYHECKEKLTYAKSLTIQENQTLKVCGSNNVSDFVMYWLYSMVKPCVKLPTLNNYAAILDKWIIPLLGDMKLREVYGEDVQNFVNVLSERGLAAGTVRNIYRVLFSALKKAKEYGYLYANPCAGIHLPEIEIEEIRVLTVQEQKKLERTAQDDKNGLPVLLALYTGMRIGELCALKWSDVDIDSSIIHVSRTTQRTQCFSPAAKTKTVLITGPAKSRGSIRMIPLPMCMVKLFSELKKTASCEFVFSHRGHPLEPRILQYRFKKLLQKAELRTINFHALRHTFATRCMELRFDVKTLSEVLGHASAKMTLDTYGHSQMEHKRIAMQSLDHLFNESA